MLSTAKMEKLVADLSARIKSLEKESIILQKEAQGVTSHSQPCHTGISEQLRIATVGTLLSGRALISGTSQWSSTPLATPTFFRLGKAQKGHDSTPLELPDQTQESISKIRVLGQGSQPCASYVATFRQLAY
ncbi:hypothetical protein BASA81_018344 [Batrachochytrium salamandrivorans]|nr:hypothetical protein BASA81_018344 [Batrachochytrium salamandrivorans]